MGNGRGLRNLLLYTVTCMGVLAAARESGAQGAPGRWSLREELRFGVQDGPDALTRISALTTDSIGNIYVVQPLDGVVRIYGPDGSPLSSLGRRGDGPGEFRVPLQSGWLGDTLWVADPSGHRVTLFRDRILVGGFRFSGPELGPEFNPPSPVAVLEDGALLFGAVPRSGGDGRRAVEVGAALRAAIDGSNSRAVAMLRFTEFPAVASPRGSSLVVSYQPFDDRTLIRVSPEGGLIVVVDRPVATGRRAAAFTIVGLSAQGDTLFHRRIDYRPIGLTREIVDRVVDLPDERLAERFPSRDAALKAIRSALLLPDFLPPISDLAVGRDQSIWLRREDLGSGSVEWLVLDKNGNAVGQLAAPRGTKILQAAPEHVWAVEEDELGVPYIVRYRVLK